MTTEAYFWAKRLRPWVAEVAYCERIENGLAAGTPDVHFALRDGRGAGWIENKFRSARPVRESTVVFPHTERGGKGMRKAQIAWWLYYLANGGQGAIGFGIWEETWLVKATPELVRGFNAMSWAEFRALPTVGEERAAGKEALWFIS